MGAATRSESSVVLPARIVVPGVIALRHLLQRVLGFLARPVRSQKIRHLGGVVVWHHRVGLEVVPPVPVGHRSSSKSPPMTLLLLVPGAAPMHSARWSAARRITGCQSSRQRFLR